MDIAAVVALLLGGLAGYLMGSSGNDEAQPAATAPAGDAASGEVASTFDMLLARTRADGEYRSPSEYPQLDEITAAAANGWTLIEQPTNSTTAPVGSVLEQIPAEGTNMIEGSVLYVKLAKRH